MNAAFSDPEQKADLKEPIRRSVLERLEEAKKKAAEQHHVRQQNIYDYTIEK